MPRDIHFVSRIRGARDDHVLTLEQFRSKAEAAKTKWGKGTPDASFTLQERFAGDVVVKPFYDWDAKFKVTPVDLEGEKQKEGKEFAQTVQRLHPDSRILYAQRHGPLDGGGYKISYRAFVCDVAMVVTDIPVHVRRTFGLPPKGTFKNLDLSVYKLREQLLGVIYGTKDTDMVKRYLIPVGEGEDPCDYLAQNVKDDAKLIEVPAGDAGLQAMVVKRYGRPKKGQSGGEGPSSTPAGKERLSGGEYESALKAATDFFGEKYRLHERFTYFVVDTERKRLRLHPESNWCFIRRDKHGSNHQYITIDDHHGARYSCHDEECREAARGRSELVIDWAMLPQQIREAYQSAFPESPEVIDADLLATAKMECQQNITDTWPNEVGLDIRRQQAMLTAHAKQQRCGKCETMMKFEQSVDGLRMHCPCGAVWPPWGYITLPRDKYPTMQQALVALQMNIGVVNVDFTINNYGAGGSGESFCGTYDNDGLVVFEGDDESNRIFLSSLQGTDADLSELVFILFRNTFHCGKAGAKGTDGIWFNFKNHRWVDKAELNLRAHLASDTCFLRFFKRALIFYEQECIQTEETKKKARAIRRLLEQLRDGARRKRILDDAILRFHEYRPVFSERLDTGNKLVFTNGVYDLSAGEFRDGCPEDFLSVALDIPYQPLDQGSADCAYVMGFMTAIQPDEKTRDYLLSLLALCLTTDTSMQYFWIFTGAGANGKSKLIKLLTDTLRDHAGAAPAALLTRRREDANQANEALSNLEKVRVAVFSEGSASEVIQVNTVKLFTGEDDISTRGLHEKQRRWTPMFKCILVCNEIPRLDENTWAGWRRFKIIPFPTKFVDNPRLPHERVKDPSVGTRLAKCRAAFAAILIHQLQRFKTDGLVESDVIREATQSYQTENDVIEEFFDEEMVPDPDAAVVATEVVSAVMQWAKSRGRRLPDKKKAVVALLSEKFGADVKTVWGRNYSNSVRGWKGYKLNENV